MPIYNADGVYKDALNGENMDIMQLNGSSQELLNEAAAVVNTYLKALTERDFEGAYNMYATDIVTRKGKEYSFDRFKVNAEEFLRKMGIEEGSGVLTAHYTGCYETERYISVSIIIGRKSNGVYDNPISVEYTIIKENGNKLLDFPYTDFDLYSYRFVENGGIGMPEIAKDHIN